MLINRCTKETINWATSDDGWTPLTWACFNGNFEIVKLLLPRCTEETVNKVTNDGWSPLAYAMSSCSLEMVKLLIEAGAIVGVKCKHVLSVFKKNPDGKMGRREILNYFEVFESKGNGELKKK